jgi:hypothetical protein
MISFEQFIKLFEKKKPITYSYFLKHARVKVGTNSFLLREYIIRKKIDLDDIKLLFENIQKRNEYLERFYNTSLKIPPSITIKEKPLLTGEMNNNKFVNFKNIIRNMFFWDILKNTKSGIENNPTYLDVLEDLYLNLIIDYKILTPSAIHYMKEGRLGSVFSSYYFRASILNPYLIYSLNKSVLKGTRVFTPTLGWSSYYYGLAETGITQYVGVDVIPSVCEGVTDFAKKYYPNIKTNIICSPSEKLLENKPFIKKYRGKFDLVFFSPPYFKLEMYEGGEQSTSNYPTYKEWLEKYWEKTIKLCEILLEDGGTLCYILSGYGSKKVKEEYDLLGDMNAITARYFELKEIQPMFNKNVHVTSHRETAEKIMVYKK